MYMMPACDATKHRVYVYCQNYYDNIVKKMYNSSIQTFIP